MSLGVNFVLLPSFKGTDYESDSSVEDEHSSFISQTKRTHEYRPLKQNEFRLLVLNPGLPDEPIECFLEHYLVSQSKRYEALSYVWGDAKESSFIQVDGCSFKVSKNLRDFLHVFRTNNTCPMLWIDAVCINQTDLPERNAQIRLMKRIYEGADQIVIWVGPEIAATKLAMVQMEILWRDVWYPRLVEHNGSTQSAVSAITADEVAKVLGDKKEDGTFELSGEVWSAVLDILKRPWWSRIWVYQEATAPARDGRFIHCGPHEIDFIVVLVANKIVRHLILGDSSLIKDHSSVGLTGVFMDVYSALRRDYHQKGTSNFLRMADLLPTLRGFAATNPRDKLYALIPTSLDGAELLDVDYSLSVEEVYTNAALSFMQKHRNLDILGHCTRPEEYSQLVLPSWVPDWTSSCAPVHFFKRRRMSTSNGDDTIAEQKANDLSVEHQIGTLYNASMGTWGGIRVDSKLGKLLCRGFLFDVVESVSSSSNDTYDCGVIAKDWVEWLEENSFLLSRKRGSYVGGINDTSTEEALAHTLVADCSKVGVDLACRGCTASLSLFSARMNEADADDVRFAGSTFGPGVTGAHPATFRRKLIVTQRRYLGLTAEHVESGDVVAILLGGQLPFVLRKVEGHYILIGEAYVHGIMDGEAMAELELPDARTRARAEDFEIW